MQQRDIGIDITKGLLTVGMVLAHFVKLFSKKVWFFDFFEQLTDFVSFSGFLFCFGFACWKAYISRPKIPWWRVLRTIFKCYAAFAISGIAFRFFIFPKSIEYKAIVRIVFLRDIPDLSEFLIAFSVITAIACLAAPLVRFASTSALRVLIVSLFFLTVTLLPKSIPPDPVVGLLIGGKGYAYYPAAQYFPFFLLGVFLARNKFNVNFVVALIGFVVLIAYIIFLSHKFTIERFPPSIIWLMLSAISVYIYYGMGFFIAKYSKYWVVKYISIVGSNVLLYLLISNLVLFSVRSCCAYIKLEVIDTMIAYLLLMLFIYFVQSINCKVKFNCYS